VAIQGWGNVGSELAKFMAKKGAKVVAVSDMWGAVQNPNGISVDEALKYAYATDEAHSVKHCKGATEVPRDSILELDCDILVPAAVGGVITDQNAPKIKAKLIIEGANNPTSAAADEILLKKGVLVIPDMLANSGGVIGSYAEYIGKTTDDAFKLIESKISQNTKAVLKGAFSGDSVLLPRTVAMNIAKERVWKAMERRKSA
jgi:glutamate dehydrogenase (NAD(P)+)